MFVRGSPRSLTDRGTVVRCSSSCCCCSARCCRCPSSGASRDRALAPVEARGGSRRCGHRREGRILVAAILDGSWDCRSLLLLLLLLLRSLLSLPFERASRDRALALVVAREVAPLRRPPLRDAGRGSRRRLPLRDAGRLRAVAPLRRPPLRDAGRLRAVDPLSRVDATRPWPPAAAIARRRAPRARHAVMRKPVTALVLSGCLQMLRHRRRCYGRLPSTDEGPSGLRARRGMASPGAVAFALRAARSRRSASFPCWDCAPVSSRGTTAAKPALRPE